MTFGPFRFVIVGHSNDPDEAIEQMSDIVPLEEARTQDGMFAAETQPMDGWRNRDTGNMNQLEVDGVITDWGRYTDLQDPNDRIMRYGK
jgi:hypothetical protein